MGVSPDLDHTNMWGKWRGSLFLLTWIILQVSVLCPTVSGLRQRTVCFNFMLIVDPPCAATEMLLPTMFTLGVSSDATCHSEITGASLKQKGVDEIRRCCQQRENDTVTDYCLPAMKNQLKDHYYLDFVNTCTAATRCQLSSPGGMVQHTAGEDYVTFTFECVHTDTGENVTVVCGANIPADVSLNCPTSTSTTTTPSTSTSTSTTSTSSSTTSTSASNTTTSTTSTSASATTTSTTDVANIISTATKQTVTSNSVFSNHTPGAVTSSAGEPGNTLPITLGVSVAVLIVGFVSGWIMSRCFYQRKTRKNGADVYNTTSTMEEEHTYSTVRPTSAATYANTSYEYYNQ